MKKVCMIRASLHVDVVDGVAAGKMLSCGTKVVEVIRSAFEAGKITNKSLYQAICGVTHNMELLTLRLQLCKESIVSGESVAEFRQQVRDALRDDLMARGCNDPFVLRWLAFPLVVTGDDNPRVEPSDLLTKDRLDALELLLAGHAKAVKDAKAKLADLPDLPPKVADLPDLPPKAADLPDLPPKLSADLPA